MTFTPQRFEIIHRETVVHETFQQTPTAWEITSKPEEQAFFKNGCYWMENRSENRWMYYKYKLPLKTKDDWMLKTEIELLSKDAYGHYGLAWGFSENREVLNRFTVSADGERCLVMQFQKDHHRVFHRYQKRIVLDPQQPIELGILKISNYFYFLLNKQVIYICEAGQFANEGPYAGYYVEPDLFIRSRHFIAERLIVQPAVAEPHETLYL
jgi:hypothetical protein